MAAEAELNGLKKLESNKYCVNCDAYNKFGHGNICEKFKTFVCSNCKSAHQSFSMRVKSVTMSNWTKEEVDALKEENGGGNAVAKRVWLGLWDDRKLRKPKEGDHMDVYKRFIDKVYNDRAFYDDNAVSNPSSSRKSAGSSRNVTATSTASSSSNAANLLDFSSPTASSSAPTFDAFASPPKSAPPANDGWGAFSSAPAPAPVAAVSSNGFDDGFGAFMAAPAAPANPMAAFDPFASSSSSSVSAPPSSSSFATPSQPAFDPFAPGNAAPIASAQSVGFGGAPQALAPMARPPPAKFSAFDALAGPQPGMGMGGRGMVMSGGMGMGGPRPGMMNGNVSMGMGMGTGMGMPQQPAMGMGMGMGGGPRPMMGNGYMAAPPQNGYGARPVVHGSVGSRDPFAGLGLPGK